MIVEPDLPIITMDDCFEEDGKTKKQKAKKPGGTFASMGLSRPIIGAIERKGYKLATPIQRKCIPAIMSGRDVVAMARTGSGKSAAFLLPLIDRLKIRQPKSDIRALIISPTRELAAQTLKFTREFTKFTNLISKLIIGGESISHDFETVTSCPDILIGTPGRLAHVLVEMKRKLDGVEIVVFDEADRLFEPGFKEMEQVNEICTRLNDSKQTLLFSATIPQRLADFAKADLKNPLFVRLDVEANLSETLKSIHLHCSQQDKFAILLHLLKNFVNKDQMTVVFMPTRHHIEYAKLLLDNTRLDCSYVYSSMDAEARKINIDKFTRKHCRVMLVTDIAARGIDIPLLDVVINFNFPFRPKLYIHRVGRVARAGRFGCAISLVSHDETPYLHALHMFLDAPMMTASTSGETGDEKIETMSQLPDKILGTVPQAILDDENDMLKRWHEHDEDLKAMVKVCDNAMKPYLKTREPPAPYAVKAAKDLHRKVMGVHPIFNLIATNESGANVQNSEDPGELNMLNRIRAYKPQSTIFEIGHIKGNQRTEAFQVMQKKRNFHDKVAKKRSHTEGDDLDSDDNSDQLVAQPMNINKGFEDSKFYLKYQPEDYVKEKGLDLDKNTFNNNIKRATMDLVADDTDRMKSQRHQMIWDRKKKKYIRADQLMDGDKKSKKIKTESGAYISASYSSGLYEKWKSQSKVDQRNRDDDDDDDDDGDGDDNQKSNNKGGRRAKMRGRSAGPNKSERFGREGQQDLDKLRAKLKPHKTRKRELKSTDEIFKERGVREKREAILRLKTMRKAERNAQRGGGGAGGSKTNTKGGQSKGGPSKGGSFKGGSKGTPQKGSRKGAPGKFRGSDQRGPKKGAPQKGGKKTPQRSGAKKTPQRGGGGSRNKRG